MDVVVDELVGRLEDAPRGTVVLLQLHHLEAREVLLQALQVLRPRAAPGVDGLVVVAHCREHPHLAHQGAHQFVLGAVGILVFVHQQMADTVLPVAAHLVTGLEQHHGVQDEVVEIHAVVGLQTALVFLVHPGDGDLHVVLRAVEGLVGQDQVVLPGGDLRPRDIRVQVQALAQDLPDQVVAVGGIEDGEAGLQAHVAVFAAQDVEAQVVEGGHGQALAFAFLQQTAGALAHLAGRLVGEGDGHDVARRQAVVLDQVGDLGGDHPGLAAAGAGQHQQGCVHMPHGGMLMGVESCHGSHSRRGCTASRQYKGNGDGSQPAIPTFTLAWFAPDYDCWPSSRPLAARVHHGPCRSGLRPRMAWLNHLFAGEARSYGDVRIPAGGPGCDSPGPR